MSELRVTVVPVGRVDRGEVEAAAAGIARVIARAVEMREPVPAPRGTEDPARGQHRAAPFLSGVAKGLTSARVAKLVGATAATANPVPVSRPDAVLFVTDLDLFRPGVEGVLGEKDTNRNVAVLSVKRMREAFYRRKSDPAKQRARLLKESLHVVGSLAGLPDCSDPRCAMASVRSIADVDAKRERYCAPCWRRLSTGSMSV